VSLVRPHHPPPPQFSYTIHRMPGSPTVCGSRVGGSWRWDHAPSTPQTARLTPWVDRQFVGLGLGWDYACNAPSTPQTAKSIPWVNRQCVGVGLGWDYARNAPSTQQTAKLIPWVDRQCVGIGLGFSWNWDYAPSTDRLLG
jgi:long-subunit fatty acid transport protein